MRSACCGLWVFVFLMLLALVVGGFGFAAGRVGSWCFSCGGLGFFGFSFMSFCLGVLVWRVVSVFLFSTRGGGTCFYIQYIARLFIYPLWRIGGHAVSRLFVIVWWLIISCGRSRSSYMGFMACV